MTAKNAQSDDHAISLKIGRATTETDADVTEAELRAALNRAMRDSLKPIALCTGIIYLVAFVTVSLSPADPDRLGIFLPIMSAIFLGIYLGFRKLPIPLEWVNLLTAICAALGLFTCVLTMHNSPEPRQTTNFMLLIVAAGALVLSTQWLIAFIVATCLSWLVLIWDAPSSPQWIHFGFTLFVASVIAVTIHLIRVRALRNLEILRMRDQARKDMLEVLLLAVRLREEEVRLLNEQLEHRVTERTAELRSSEERNRTLFNELNHVSRVATMGELAASIAHEVNQPLCAIINNAAYCNRWLEKPAANLPDLEEMREAVSDITESGRRASEVIARIRTMLRKGEAVRARLDVNEIIHQVVSLMRNEALKRNVSLNMNLAPDLPAVFGDRVQLQQVILNLIINGFDAMNDVESEKRELRICSSLSEYDTVLVKVSDTGIGIDQINSQKIFDAFYTTKPHGLGMGLSICQTIIGAHGGRLWAGNDPGSGATFQFSLPIFEDAQNGQ